MTPGTVLYRVGTSPEVGFATAGHLPGLAVLTRENAVVTWSAIDIMIACETEVFVAALRRWSAWRLCALNASNERLRCPWRAPG